MPQLQCAGERQPHRRRRHSRATERLAAHFPDVRPPRPRRVSLPVQWRFCGPRYRKPLGLELWPSLSFLNFVWRCSQTLWEGPGNVAAPSLISDVTGGFRHGWVGAVECNRGPVLCSCDLLVGARKARFHFECAIGGRPDPEEDVRKAQQVVPYLMFLSKPWVSGFDWGSAGRLGCGGCT